MLNDMTKTIFTIILLIMMGATTVLCIAAGALGVAGGVMAILCAAIILINEH
jgi:hypothetical protein